MKFYQPRFAVVVLFSYDTFFEKKYIASLKIAENV